MVKDMTASVEWLDVLAAGLVDSSDPSRPGCARMPCKGSLKSWGRFMLFQVYAAVGSGCDTAIPGPLECV